MRTTALLTRLTTLCIVCALSTSLAAVEITGVQGTMLGLDGGITLYDLQSGARTVIVDKAQIDQLTGGHGSAFTLPRFSPDGKQVVFWHDWWLDDWSAKAPGAMWIADNDGGNLTRIVDAHVDHAEIGYQSLSWCTDGYIYFSRQTDTILRVNPNTRSEEVYWAAVGVSGYKTDGVDYGPYVENLVVSRDGTMGVSSNGGKVHGLDLTNRLFIRSCGGGCRGGITTNGDQIVHWLTCCGYYPPGYSGDNAFLKVTVLQSMDDCDDTAYMYAPGSADAPNPEALQYWMYRGACNSNDYLAGRGYGNENGVLQNKNTSDYLVVPTFPATDFYLGALPAPPSPTPRIALDASQLNFVSTGAVPASQTVQVTNSGAGTLTDVTVTEDASWLTVTRSGSGNAQTLTNACDPAGLATGAYTATVSVSDGGATNTESYDVTLNVGSAVAAPSNLSASPGTEDLTASVIWQDNATTEDGYLVERQPSGGGWSQVASLAANSQSWIDSGLASGDYTYRVRAYAGTDTSAWSNTASVTINAVITISVTNPQSSQVVQAGSVLTIQWTATNSSGVQIEWSADAGESWAVLSIGGAVHQSDTNWNAFHWAVPDTESSDCLMRVMEYADHTIYGETAFSVHATSVVQPSAVTHRTPRHQPTHLVDLRGRVIRITPEQIPTGRSPAAMKDCGTFGIMIGR